MSDPIPSFTVEATDIRTTAIELDGPFEGDPTTLLGSCETTFLVHVVDADAPPISFIPSITPAKVPSDPSRNSASIG